MGKNEISKSTNNTPTYSQKDSGSRTTDNKTDVYRETYEPNKTTFEHIHSETHVEEHVSSKRK